MHRNRRAHFQLDVRAGLSKTPFASSGITLIELLVVLSILGVVLALGVINIRQALIGSEARAAIQTVRQAIWQGATAASARGRTITLTRSGNSLRLMDGNVVVRSDDLPSGVTVSFPQGLLLEFSPPGKVTADSLEEFMNGDPWIRGDGRTTRIQVSLIGEVRTEGGD